MGGRRFKFQLQVPPAKFLCHRFQENEEASVAVAAAAATAAAVRSGLLVLELRCCDQLKQFENVKP